MAYDPSGNVFEQILGQLVSIAGGGAELIALAVFRATGPGDGYSTGDIIVLRQLTPNEPEYYNASTNAVITIPDPSELGPVSTAANVIVSSALPAGSNNIGDVDILTLPIAFNAGATSPTTQRVVVASDQTALPVAGTFFQATQPVSLTTLPTLPAGVNNIGDVDVLTLPVAFNAGAASATTQRVVVASDQAALPVTGTFFQATQPVSLAALPTLAAGSNNIGDVDILTLPVAFSAGAVTATTQRVVVASDQAAIPVLPSSVLTTSTQTLTALGLSTAVSGVGKASVGVQLLWTGASTSQVVRLEGSMDGGTTWVSLSDSLPGDTFTTTEIADRAAAGLQPGIRHRAFRAEYASYRLRWVSGTATNLTIVWGLV